LGLEYIYN